MKYIIDVPDNTKQVDAMYLWYPLKSYSLSELEPYTEPDCKAIEDEVWELARRIICPSDCCEDSISAHTKEIFNKEGWEIRGIFNDLSYQEAKAKYEEWKKQKDKIKVGDEVILDEVNTKAVVTAKESDDVYYMALTENGLYEVFKEYEVKKTGRHFPEVAELLEKMRGEE